MKRQIRGVKADWQCYLRTLRRREIEIIFRRCPQDAFSCGLELGAGDGFQSTLLAPYVRRLTATDYRSIFDPALLQHEANRDGRISFATCDAERVDEAFGPGVFDLVFSSNMLEHLPDPSRALSGIRKVMANDGIAIHVVPSPFWKLSHVLGFYPNAVLSRIERLARRPKEEQAQQAVADPQEWDNNPKVAARPRPYLARLLWPAAHGASGSNLREFTLFTRRHWQAQFKAAGFRVAAMLRGPVSSGYGFGLDRVRAALERAGFSSETIYITVKAERRSIERRCLSYFDGRNS